MSWTELEMKVIRWAEDRRIIPNATPPKLIEFRKDGKFFRVMKRSWE